MLLYIGEVNIDILKKYVDLLVRENFEKQHLGYTEQHMIMLRVDFLNDISRSVRKSRRVMGCEYD